MKKHAILAAIATLLLAATGTATAQNLAIVNGKAVPASHGIKDAFSVGSQYHQPPQPKV